MAIHYRVNPTPPPQTSLASDQIIEAINAGAAAWMTANPKVILVFDGTTDDAPAGYNNVVGFAPSDTSQVTVYPLTGQYTTAFNLVLSSKDVWSWKPCRPPDDPCDPYASETRNDLQDVVTHEWGHVLGLGHVEDIELTMYPGTDPPFGHASRTRVTLGLGDVLGVRKLYPCDCPLPALYRP